MATKELPLQSGIIVCEALPGGTYFKLIHSMLGVFTSIGLTVYYSQLFSSVN